MIVCSLNGKTAYPSSSDKIKVTYENQFVKDSGSYTYDISFPMDIARNRELFKNVQRLDVKKTVGDFEDCKLYADNRLIISGKGTVTSITNDVVKLQIDTLPGSGQTPPWKRAKARNRHTGPYKLFLSFIFTAYPT